MSEPIDTTDMRRAARAVYLATDAPVADELSRMLASAAREIDRLRSENVKLRRYVDTVDSYFIEHGWSSIALLDARRTLMDEIGESGREVTGR